MKKQLKFVVLAFLLTATTFTMVNAQSFKKSDRILEGTAAYTKATDVKASWSLNPSVGYFVTSKVALGVAGSFGDDAGTKTTCVGAFGRCYFMTVGKNLNVYSQVGVSANSLNDTAKTTSTSAGLGLGANYTLTSRLGLSVGLTDLISYESQDSHSVMTVGFSGINNPLATAKFGLIYRF